MSDEEEENKLAPLSSECSVIPLEHQHTMLQNQAVLDQIMREKRGEPSKFQSHWEKDEQDVDLATEEQIRTIPSKRMLWAAENNHMDVARELLATDSKLVLCQDEDSYTPLHRASYNGHVDMVRYLLKKGANISAVTVDHWQPLHSACRWNNVDVAAVLLQHGADVNAQTEGGQTPLHIAAQNNEDCQKILELLLHQRSVKPHLRNNQGDTAHDICARSNAFHSIFEMAAPSINELKPMPGKS